MSLSSILVLASGIVLGAQAHMTLNTPKPFAEPVANIAPLLPDGSNFPCQIIQGGSVVDGPGNVFALGSVQPLTFNGQSVHGGGSCQVSLTTDTVPNKNSQWKVIHSIVGGCPARGEVGNIAPDNDSTAPDPYTYNFTVPSNIPAGNYTLSWSWLNKVGNREFYQNCAPVTLTGMGGDKKNLDSLPDMFVANINVPGACTGVPDGSDTVFPDPGPSVETLAGSMTSALATPVCSQSPAVHVAPTSVTLAAAPPAKTTHASPATADPKKPAPTKSTSTSAPPPQATGPNAGSNSCDPVSDGFYCKGSTYTVCLMTHQWQEMPLAPGTECIPGPGLTIINANTPRQVETTSTSAPPPQETGPNAGSNSCDPVSDGFYCKGSTYTVCLKTKEWLELPLAAGMECIPGPGLTLVNANKRRQVKFEA